MKESKNLIGQKFSRWTVIDYSDKTNKHYDRYWVCQCECKDKTIRAVSEVNLLKGRSKSCGCLSSEKTIEMNKERAKTNKFPHYKRIFSIYDGMRKRCYHENNDNYKNYGGRGVTICDEWLSDFMCFYDWAINHGYSDDLTIDRIDVNGNYELENCRWATWEEQFYNKTNTVYITLDGETKTILDWCKISGLSYSTIWQRYYKSELRTKEGVLKPPKKTIKFIHKGEEKTFSQLAKETGIDHGLLYWRYRQGLRDDELVRPADRWYEKHIQVKESNKI